MRNWNFDVAVLLLRVGIGLVFIPHGYAKVFGAGGAAAFAADVPNYHLPVFLGYVAAYAEMFGAVFLIAGFLTRLDALLLAGTMAAAAFLVQLPDALYGLQPGASKFMETMRAIELPFTLMMGCLTLVLLGPGRISIDALLGLEGRVAGLFRKKKAAAEAAAVQTRS
jgi:putative oxidoreductase